MKNAARTIISLIRANPSYARLAITLDACIGAIFGILAYVFMSAASVKVTNLSVLAIAAAFALVAIAVAGYAYLYKTGFDATDPEFFGPDED